MNTIEDMLDTWQKSSSVMHIAHHVTAARYSKYNRWFGSIVSGLSALVASSIFVAVLLDRQNKYLFVIAAMVSLITAILTGVNSSLGLAQRSQSHHNSAVGFQGLRREIEEELVRCRSGTVKDSYEHLRNRWTEALKEAPPLPKDVHDSVKRNLETEHKE